MKYSRYKLISLLLAGSLVVGDGVSVLGSYNGGSTVGGGNVSSGGSSGSNLKDYNATDQFFSYNLYFLEMPPELLGNSEEKKEARDAYWKDNASKAVKIGNELLVARDDVVQKGIKDRANSTFGGDIFSVFGQLKDYGSKKTFKKGALELVSASEIGLPNADKYPIYMSSVNGKEILKPGLSTLDYFMSKKENANTEVEAEYTPKDEMKNLVRYLAGKRGDKARVSFKDDPDSLEVAGITYNKNNDSVLDEGIYNGKVGEYKLFIESGMVANNVAYTVRELVSQDPKQGGNGGLVWNLKPSALSNAAKNVYLTEDDAFSLKGTSPEELNTKLKTNNNYMDNFDKDKKDIYLKDGHLGGGINILSSELFRNPVQRTIGTHTNVFLDSGDAVAFEYVGDGSEVSVESSEAFKEIIRDNTLDEIYASKVVGIGLGGLGSGYTLDYVLGGLQDSVVRAGIGLGKQTNVGTYMSVGSLISMANSEGSSKNSVMATDFETLSKERAQGVKVLDEGAHERLKGLDDGSGSLSDEARGILKSNAYVNPDNDYVDTLREYDSKGVKFVPVAAGGTVMKVLDAGDGNTISPAKLPKGILKDITSQTMDMIGMVLRGQYSNSGDVSTFSSDGSGTIGDIVSGVLGSGIPSMCQRGIGASTSLSVSNELVNVTDLEGASYGVEVDGKVRDKSINTYRVNAIVENTLSLASVYGENSIDIDAYDGASFNQDKPIRAWLSNGKTQIEPYRFFGGEANNNLGNLVEVADAARHSEVTHVEGAGVDKYYDASSIGVMQGKSKDGVVSQSEYIQDVSEVALNSVLPKTLSEISDSSHYKNDILGNYGISYTIWDVGIPVDLIVMTRGVDGKLKVLDGVIDGKDGYGILTDQWYVPANTERILGIPSKIKFEQENGDLELVPEEVVIKPACVSLEEFISKYEGVIGNDGAKIDFGNGLTSTVKQAPFTYTTNANSRAVISAVGSGSENLAGSVNHYINNGKGSLEGAISIVASDCDKDAHINNPNENRMALVVTVDIGNANDVTQYNVIETKRNGEVVGTEVIKTKPKYDANGDVVLDEVIDGAKQQEWVTSEEDEEPSKWVDVESNIKVEDSSEKPTPIIPQVDKDGDGEKDKDNIYVRYEKDVQESKLRLTEKRISWKKDLTALGGLPEVTFSWDAVDGHHVYYDGCGTEESPCPGHDCYEHLADDTFFRLVATNITPIDGSIIGSVEPFLPKNSDNVHEVNRGSDEDRYVMKPNYHYAIWRGDDKPTIAAYKYDDKNEVRDNLNDIFRLIGKEQEGIENVGSRHKANHSNYIKNTSFNITKAYYDTGTMGQFSGHYGTGDANKAGDLYDSDVKAWEALKEDEYEQELAIETARQELRDAEAEYKKLVEGKDKRHEIEEAYANYVREQDECAEAEEVYAKYLEDLKVARDTVDAVSGAVGGNIGDYNYNTNWGHHDDLKYFDANGTGQVYDIDIQVDVEYGEANDISKQQRNNASSSSFKTADGTVWGNAKGNNLHNGVPIEYTPYVEMYYDTVGSEKQNVPVYTLGGHKSTMLSNDYVEIGYNTYGKGEHKTGLILSSEQWSTHSKASALGGTETVLPGGAIYKLSTPNGDGVSRTKVAVSSWQTVIPDDVASGIINVDAKTYYTLANAQKRNNDLFYKIVKSLNSLDVVQYVSGKEILQGDMGTDTPSGQPLSQDKKYWLNQGNTDGRDGSYENATAMGSTKTNEGDLDITDRVVDMVNYYRIYADVNGNITVKKGKTIPDTAPSGKGTPIAMIKKGEGIDKLLSNAEVAELDNKTKLVSNFVNTLDRNTGNDVSLADGKWYNEAWDGIVVMKTDRVIEIGFNDNRKDNAIRSAALDVKLTPMKANQYGLYTDKVDSYFGTRSHSNLSDKNGYVGMIGGIYENGNKSNVEIYMGDMRGLYRSKDFVIPNATVMDLH